MQTTKRKTPDYRTAPATSELRKLTSFSYKESDDSDLRITFSKTHKNDPTRTSAWNATVCRTTDGKRRTACVYAGTDNTLPNRWSQTLKTIKEKAQTL